MKNNLAFRSKARSRSRLSVAAILREAYLRFEKDARTLAIVRRVLR